MVIPPVRGRLKVVFLPEYDVSLAERLIPASDVSNQISTAGYEASGTSNMKFMMNGALTIGTRDGATIEMAEEAGEENFFLFGLTAEQVADSRGWYNPHWHYDNEPETRAALDLIFSDHFSRHEPGIFAPLRDTLLTHGDHYMHLADLEVLSGGGSSGCSNLYANPEEWARKAILNVAGSGKFSSDRTIAEYAAEIWNVKPCPVAVISALRDRWKSRHWRASPPPQGDADRRGPVLAAYYSGESPISMTEPDGQLRHQRPPRLFARRHVHRGAHSGDHAGDLRLPPSNRRPTGRSISGKDTHALSDPGAADCPRGPGGQRCRTIIRRDERRSPRRR